MADYQSSSGPAVAMRPAPPPPPPRPRRGQYIAADYTLLACSLRHADSRLCLGSRDRAGHRLAGGRILDHDRLGLVDRAAPGRPPNHDRRRGGRVRVFDLSLHPAAGFRAAGRYESGHAARAAVQRTRRQSAHHGRNGRPSGPRHRSSIRRCCRTPRAKRCAICRRFGVADVFRTGPLIGAIVAAVLGVASVAAFAFFYVRSVPAPGSIAI